MTHHLFVYGTLSPRHAPPEIAAAVRRLSVVGDGLGVVAERLVRARDVDVGPVIVGARRERILVVSERLVEITCGKTVAATLAGDRLDTFIATARSGGRDARSVVLILTRLDCFDLLLLPLKLILLLLNQFVRGLDLIAHASRNDEQENAEC